MHSAKILQTTKTFFIGWDKYDSGKYLFNIFAEQNHLAIFSCPLNFPFSKYRHVGIVENKTLLSIISRGSPIELTIVGLSLRIKFFKANNSLARFVVLESFEE